METKLLTEHLRPDLVRPHLRDLEVFGSRELPGVQHSSTRQGWTGEGDAIECLFLAAAATE